MIISPPTAISSTHLDAATTTTSLIADISQATMSASKEIPLLDMSNWEAGSVANKVQFGKDLVASFKNHGAAKIVNYGISESKLLDIFEFV